MIRTVPVSLGERSYDVRIGPGLIARAGEEIAPLLPRPRVAILTDERVAALHLPAMTAALERAGIREIKDGQAITFDIEKGRDGRESATNVALA